MMARLEYVYFLQAIREYSRVMNKLILQHTRVLNIFLTEQYCRIDNI